MAEDKKTVDLVVEDPEYCRLLSDPKVSGIKHIEALLSFTEVAKLKRGNANIRPPEQKKKPFKAMLNSVEFTPDLFHIKNRGITYICTNAKFDDANKLAITVPTHGSGKNEAKYGIADGGHTFEVVTQTVANQEEFNSIAKWKMPFVRVHFLISKDPDNMEEIVEALNTSLQVQQFTLDEYQNKFDVLKRALEHANFDLNLVAFRENEDKEWHVIEIIQRVACFLKERWVGIQPINMYKSKGKALKLFTTEDTRGEFKQLFDVIKDIITLPEYIQHRFSMGEIIPPKSLGKLKCSKALKKPYTRPGTEYPTMHKIDMAALLPLAAGFRALLSKGRGADNNRLDWRVDPKEVFELCAAQLYQHLVVHSGRAVISSQLASDVAYWSGCAQIISEAKDEYLDKKSTRSITRKRKVVEDGDDSNEKPEQAENAENGRAAKEA